MTMEKPYYRTFSDYMKKRFGQKVYRVSLDAGFTCPNRDGTNGIDGCAYCSAQGSWNPSRFSRTIEQQVKTGKELVRRRYGAKKFLAYFQAYTNTYASVETLKKIYDSVVLKDEDFVGLVIGTRPDCIDRDKLSLISSYKTLGLDVWIEYGLQSALNATLKLIGRGHTAEDFRNAVMLTKEYGVMVGSHVIIGLPNETRSNLTYTASFLADLPMDVVKLHNLNIIKGTRMADWLYEGNVRPLGLKEYADLAVDFLERTDPNVAVARLVTESDSSCLIEPKWSLQKAQAMKEIIKCFETRKSFQGRLFKKRDH